MTPWIAARQASLSITNSRSSLRLMSIELVMPSSHLILCRPLLLLPPIPPSIRVFSNESTLHMRWPKYWSFCFSINPSKEHPGLISFRIESLNKFMVRKMFHKETNLGSIYWTAIKKSVPMSIKLREALWVQSGTWVKQEAEVSKPQKNCLYYITLYPIYIYYWCIPMVLFITFYTSFKVWYCMIYWL